MFALVIKDANNAGGECNCKKKMTTVHAYCRCSEKLLCWVKGCRPQGALYPPHTDSEPHTARGIPSFPLDLLGLPSKQEKKKERVRDR